jgi:hypothetical protein
LGKLLANIDSLIPPSVSPDGQRVAFSGSAGDASHGKYAIFPVNSNGTGITKLTDGVFAEFDRHFPNERAALKLLYLAIRNITTKRGGEVGTGTWGWTACLNQLAIYFPRRLIIV